MSLNYAKASGSSKPRVRVADGVYPARVVRVIDLGVQVQTDWKTGEPKTWDDGNVMRKPEVWIDFEFPTETIEVEGEKRPLWQGKRYIVSNHEKSGMFALLLACGKDPARGSVADLLGEALQIQIGTTSGGNAKITGVSALMSGFEVPPLQNPTLLFDMDDYDEDVYETLPTFLQEMIDATREPVETDNPFE